MLYASRIYSLVILFALFIARSEAQSKRDTPYLFNGDSNGIQLISDSGIQEVRCEGFDATGNPAFSFTLFPSLKQQLKNKQGNLLSDGVYFCRCIVKKNKGDTNPDPGRLTKSLGQITYESGILLYNQGKTEEAADVFKHTAEAFPDEPTFWLCLGATQYKKLTTAPEREKVSYAKEALESYKKALALSQDCKIRDNSIGYIATIYDQLEDQESNREWLLQRATGPCATNEIKAGTYYSIGVKYWQCAYDLSTRYANKQLLSSEPFHARNFHHRPDKDKFDECVMKSFEYLEKALAAKPDYAEAWSYKSLLYREKQKSTASKLQRKQFETEAEKAAKIAIDLSVRQRDKIEKQ